MRSSLFFLFMIFCTNIDAQHKSGEPLTFADPAMDSLVREHTTAILTIRIIHAPDTISRVPIKCSYVRFGPDVQSDRFYQFDRNGFAKIVLDYHMPYQQIWLRIDHYLYTGIYVNTELNIIIDASKTKGDDGFYMIDNGMEYAGTDGELNTVMNKYMLYKQDVRNKLGNDFYTLAMTRKIYGESEFISKFDSVYKAIDAIDDEFIVHYPNFKWAIDNQLKAECYGWMCIAFCRDKMPDSIFKRIDTFAPYFTSNEGVSFYKYFLYYITSKKDNPKFIVDEQLYGRYANYTKEQKAVLDSLKYYSQLPDDDKKEEALKSINKNKGELFLDEIAKIITVHFLHLIDSVCTLPKADILKTFLLGKNSYAETYPVIIKTMQTNWCRDIVKIALKEATFKQQQIDSLLSIAVVLKDNSSFIGKPLESLPFNADLYSLDSVKSLNEFIMSLKSKFPTKALVIDFWATWCVPCLEDLPKSKQLHERNKDLPIEFIYICTNSSSNITRWKNKIAELQLPGTHIFADDKIVSELKSKFDAGGSGFPTYVVIDKNGKLKAKAIIWMDNLDRDTLKIATGL